MASSTVASFTIASDTALPSGPPWLEDARRCISRPHTLAALSAVNAALQPRVEASLKRRRP